jgi:hypothetical protein
MRADDRTQEQKDQFIIKDNVGYGERERETLADEWDTEKLEDRGLDIPEDRQEEEEEAKEDDYTIPNEIKTNIKR